MTQKIAVLPCSGITRALGLITQEVCFKLRELRPEVKILCPIRLATNKNKYQKEIRDTTVIVLDGCGVRCATKLIEQFTYDRLVKVSIQEECKKYNVSLGKELGLTKEAKGVAEKIAEQLSKDILAERNKAQQAQPERDFSSNSYYEVTYDKYHFRVPKEGYYFNENDCWVKPEGETALVGISDYLQNKASDILFVDFPEVGQSIEQFGEVVDFESSKAILQLLSPVSGSIKSLNNQLVSTPSLLNQDPYEQGWVAEIALQDLEDDKELLMTGKEYFDYMKKKIEDEYL